MLDLINVNLSDLRIPILCQAFSKELEMCAVHLPLSENVKPKCLCSVTVFSTVLFHITIRMMGLILFFLKISWTRFLMD